ncbi:MAG: elongation factor G-like protein EF-G2 [Nostocoides sp.]
MAGGSLNSGVDRARVRNVVLVGPRASGKTSLVEALLLANGTINRLGSVSAGTTVSDHAETEQRLGHSVALSIATVDIADDTFTAGAGAVQLTLLDTPGMPDFVGDLRAGLRGGDAALFVISAVDGIDPATRLLWSECAAVGMPRALVLTHLDQPRADFDAAVADARSAFGDGIHPLYVPTDGGVHALLSGTVRSASGERRTVLQASHEDAKMFADLREALVEAIITESEDEGLLDRYLSGEQVGFDTLVGDLEKAVARAAFHPVVPAGPMDGLGVAEVLELICRGFPTPAEHHMPRAYLVNGGSAPTIDPTDEAPLVAQVLKTTSDSYVGRVSVLRIFAGTLTPETPVHISGHLAQFTGDEADAGWHADHDLDERSGALSRMLGATLTPVTQARAGDIVAVAHLGGAETGDTISAATSPVVVEPWSFPHPLLPVAIKAASSKDEDKLVKGLARLTAEHPSAMVVVDPQTHQLVLWTMGEQQLELLLDTLRTKGGLEVETEPVKVAVHETVRAVAKGTGRHVKQSGGHGQYAICHIVIEPLGQGGGFEFVDEVVGGAVPRQFIPSVEKGVRAQLDKGVNGYPMVDVRVRLVDGKAHSVDSSDAAFQVAGALALRDAANAAGIQLLEPMDDVAITVADDYVGAILSDLATRRGRVRGTEPADEEGRTLVRADVPALELIRYTSSLRSLAHGSGSFARTPSYYAPVPAQVQDRLTTG